MTDVIERFRRSLIQRDGAGQTDAQLLNDYVCRRDDAALTALIRRHASMVWGVCRRVLPDHHDAEDAFQATFLVLVRRATSIATPELLANWLYGVASQTAHKARSMKARRRQRERPFADPPEGAADTTCDPGADLRPVLDQELNRLPDKYRVAIVLCELEGRTRRQAAQQLGVPDGTVAARLSRGRALLARRLARRGLVPSAVSLATVFSSPAAPAALVARTGQAIPTMAGPVATLADEVVRGLVWVKWKGAVLLMVGLGVLAGTVWTSDRLRDPAGAMKSPPSLAVPAMPDIVAGPAHEILQGTWRPIASEVDGLKDFDTGLNHTQLRFSGDRATYWTSKGPLEGTLRLDPAQVPAAIDIEFDNGSVLRGIYEFEGTRLRFCWTKGGRRPSNFDTRTGELLTFLYTYEKHR